MDTSVVGLTLRIQFAFFEEVSIIRETVPLDEKIFQVFESLGFQCGPPLGTALSASVEVLVIAADLGITVPSSTICRRDSPHNGPNREKHGMRSVEKTPNS